MLKWQIFCGVVHVDAWAWCSMLNAFSLVRLCFSSFYTSRKQKICIISSYREYKQYYNNTCIWGWIVVATLIPISRTKNMDIYFTYLQIHGFMYIASNNYSGTWYFIKTETTHKHFCNLIKLSKALHINYISSKNCRKKNEFSKFYFSIFLM